MKSVVYLILLLIFTLSSNAEGAKPTELREWSLKDGDKLAGRAIEMTPNGSIQLVTPDRSELTLGIDEFSEADQKFLEEHFRKTASPQSNLTGVHRGPLKIDGGSSFYLYLPKNLNPSLRAPVMIWTQSNGSSNDTLIPFTEAADLLGMIIASPTETGSNELISVADNMAYTRTVLSKLKGKFSINRKALHFGGDKSGAVAAIQNSSKTQNAGTFTVSGFFIPEMDLPKKGVHFMAGEPNSPHRYLTASAAGQFGERATHYLYGGEREMPGTLDTTIGMIWMYAQGLYQNDPSRAAETKAFEARFLPWLQELAKTSEIDAAYLTHMLTTKCDLKGQFKVEIERLHAELITKPHVSLHLEGTAALDLFSEDELAEFGKDHKTPPEQATQKIKRTAEPLATKYRDAKAVRPIFERLTQKPGKFSEADQAFLDLRFGEQAVPKVAQAGIHSGPLKAAANTSYYLYLPKDFNPKASSPVLIWTQSDGARADTLYPFSEAADALGMIIASPVEAKNEGGVTLINNLAHTRAVLAQLTRDFTIGRESIHFGGEKTGSVAAFNHSLALKGAGTFTVSACLTPAMTTVPSGHHFMAGSTNSTYRYLTAWTAVKFRDEATHYFYEGTRGMPGTRDTAIGMTWMYAQGLYENIIPRRKEAAEFEKRFLPWLKELADTSREDALYLTRMLTSKCKLRGRFQAEINHLHAGLARDPKAVEHVRGVDALDEFSSEQLFKYGNHFAPLPNHVPSKFERMTEKLAAKYRNAEELQSLFKRLAEPTHR